MAKLGYTFYPKDFASDPDVMLMTSSERGIYRDLIDLAYLTENCIKYSPEALSRYTNGSVEDVQKVLETKGLFVDGIWTIPSCNKRLAIMKRNQENGSKPKSKPNLTQIEAKEEKKVSQITKQREVEVEIEVEDIKPNGFNLFQNFNSDFKVKWDLWISHLNEKGKSPTVGQLSEQISLLNEFPQKVAEQIISNSLNGGYPSLYRPKLENTHNPEAKPSNIGVKRPDGLKKTR